VLCQRSEAHLQEVGAKFEADYGDNMRSVIEKECSGEVENILTAPLRSESDTRALVCHQACAGAGTDEDTLIDAILTADADQINALNETWTKRFGLPIMARIMIDGVLMGAFHYCLEQTTCGNKPSGGVEQDKVVEDCKLLISFMEEKKGTDEKGIAKLFAERSRAHLEFLNEEYKKHSPKKWSLADAIRDECSGTKEAAFLACITPLPQYWAQRFDKAMKGLGNNKTMLTNAVLFSGVHLKDAAAQYKHDTGNDFVEVVAKELRGDLEAALLPYIKYRL